MQAKANAIKSNEHPFDNWTDWIAKINGLQIGKNITIKTHNQTPNHNKKQKFVCIIILLFLTFKKEKYQNKKIYCQKQLQFKPFVW